MSKFMMILKILSPIVDMTKLGDYLLDALEIYVKDSNNKTDDILVLPVIKGLRIAVNIPDEDEKPNMELVK